MKKLHFLLIAFCLHSVCANAFSGSGSGTEANPYQICTAAQLDEIRYNLSAHYKLMNDIDLTEYLSEGNPGYNYGRGWMPIATNDNYFTGKLNGMNNIDLHDFIQENGVGTQVSDVYVMNWLPIGTTAKPFTGTLKGNGYNITGIYAYYDYSDYGDANLGLFGYAEGATFSNINIQINRLVGRYRYNVGGLAGYCKASTISECSVTGTRFLTTQNYYDPSNVGGLIGYCENSTITKCSSYYSEWTYAMGDYSNIGGLVGYSKNSAINQSYASPIVVRAYYSNSATGGLVGKNENSTIDKCYATAFVTTTNTSGGLVGINNGGTITDSYYNIEKSNQSDTGKGTGVTTAQMNDINTYSSWDFTSVWKMPQACGTPLFQWQIEPFESGCGTEENPYLIAIPEGLDAVRNHLLDTIIYHYKLTNDIDLSDYLQKGSLGYNRGSGWQKIGGGEIGLFRGNFDGNGHKISGVWVMNTNDYNVGFFGDIYKSVIKNLEIEIAPDKSIVINKKTKEKSASSIRKVIKVA